MKKSLFAFSLIALTMGSCKNAQKQEKPTAKKQEKQTQKTDSLSTLHGEFIYTSDAAVLKGDSFIYGVVIDSMSTVLSKKVAPLKREPYDMVPVVVKGKVKPNPNKEGWEKVVAIKKIINVSKPTSDSAIKIEKGEEK